MEHLQLRESNKKLTLTNEEFSNLTNIKLFRTTVDPIPHQELAKDRLPASSTATLAHSFKIIHKKQSHYQQLVKIDN